MPEINNNANFYWTIAVYLIVLFAVIAGFWLLRKYMQNGNLNMRGGANAKAMRVIERIMLAQDKQIILMEIKDKIIMIGITRDRMVNLGEFINDGSFIINNNANNSSGNNSNSFADFLGEKLNFGRNKFDKNSKNNMNDRNDRNDENNENN